MQKNISSLSKIALKYVLPALLLLASTALAQSSHWSEAQAQAWYAQQPWLVGANYAPAYAINQLEMWQAETFDSSAIDTELGWAESIGMNTMRVFLHDLPWQQDARGFQQRISHFLDICARHHIRPMFVLFDSVWDPLPHLGPQHPPVPGIHNSGWVQSPGAKALGDPAQEKRLKAYVQGVIGAFGNDPRVLAWDLWNEPNNTNGGSYAREELPNKVAVVESLLPKVFAWAREMHPTQPLTSGVWDIDYEHGGAIAAIPQIQLQNSDVISFHNYGWPEKFEREVEFLQKYNRPLICTEYMARANGSLFETVLPVAKKYNVAAINWGFVAGKTQTNLPWESWQHPYVVDPPPIWFHDIFRPDGIPYREAETKFIREITRRGVSVANTTR